MPLGLYASISYHLHYIVYRTIQNTSSIPITVLHTPFQASIILFFTMEGFQPDNGFQQGGFQQGGFQQSGFQQEGYQQGGFKPTSGKVQSLNIFQPQ